MFGARWMQKSLIKRGFQTSIIRRTCSSVASARRVAARSCSRGGVYVRLCAWLNFISAALFTRRIIKILRIKNGQIFSFHRDLDDLARRKL